jgi:hypothetical protein
MPKSPSGGNLQTLRSRWSTPKRQRLLDKLFGQRCFADFFSPEDENPEDPTLIKDVRAADLAGRDLHDLMLTNADVRWTDFSEARIQGTFQHVNLAQANFARAVLTGCRFWKARAISAAFDRTAMLKVSFDASSLFGASLRAAQLTEVAFVDTDLRGADFSGALLQGCVLERVKLEERERGFWEAMGAERCRLIEVQWCEEALAEA